MVSDGKGTTFILTDKTFCAFLFVDFALYACFLVRHEDYT